MNYSQTNLTDLINKARNSTFNVINGVHVNQTTMTTIQTITKNALSKSITNCQRNDNPIDIHDWCFRDIATEISTSIRSQLKGNWTVTVGKSNACFTNSASVNYFTQREEYIFQLNDMFFEILNYYNP
jgi:hypothetical protein